MANSFNDDQLPLEDSPNELIEVLNAEQKRLKAIQGSPTEREHYTRNIAIYSKSYQSAVEYVDNLLARSARGREPGGLWLLGEGGSITFKYTCLVINRLNLEFNNFLFYVHIASCL